VTQCALLSTIRISTPFHKCGEDSLLCRLKGSWIESSIRLSRSLEKLAADRENSLPAPLPSVWLYRLLNAKSFQAFALLGWSRISCQPATRYSYLQTRCLEPVSLSSLAKEFISDSPVTKDTKPCDTVSISCGKILLSI